MYSLELLKMDIEVPETCWAYYKCNKLFSGIIWFFFSTHMPMMGGRTHIKFPRQSNSWLHYMLLCDAFVFTVCGVNYWHLFSFLLVVWGSTQSQCGNKLKCCYFDNEVRFLKVNLEVIWMCVCLIFVQDFMILFCW